MAKKYDYSSIEGLKDAFNDAVEEMAHEVLWQIENIYETAIDRFYADYNPLYYSRTGATYVASSGYYDLFSPQNIMGGDGNWTAGIKVNSQLIPSGTYRADPNWVFARTFNKGIHGISYGKIFGKDRNKTYTRMKGKFYKTYKVDLIPGSSPLKHTTITKHYNSGFKLTSRTMSNMSPTPKAIMGREFKILTRKKNMKRMFNDILSSKIT